LKDAGQIDPNALYCTPDETLIKIEEINSRIDSANSRIDSTDSRIDSTDSRIDLLDSNTVHKTGDETIAGLKTFEKVISTNDTVLMRRTNDSSYGEWFGGSAYNKGGYFRADGINSPDYPGGFVASATDGVNFKRLVGLPNGDLFWDNKNLANNLSATISKAQNGYCKLSNGLIIQWGLTPVINAQDVYVSLPTPFTTNHYAVTGNMNFSGGSNNISFYNLTTTGFQTRVGAGGYSYWFIAIGY
jgi:hypothetical protein